MEFTLLSESFAFFTNQKQKHKQFSFGQVSFFRVTADLPSFCQFFSITTVSKLFFNFRPRDEVSLRMNAFPNLLKFFILQRFCKIWLTFFFLLKSRLRWRWRSLISMLILWTLSWVFWFLFRLYGRWFLLSLWLSFGGRFWLWFFVLLLVIIVIIEYRHFCSDICINVNKWGFDFILSESDPSKNFFHIDVVEGAFTYVNRILPRSLRFSRIFFCMRGGRPENLMKDMAVPSSMTPLDLGSR